MRPVEFPTITLVRTVPVHYFIRRNSQRIQNDCFLNRFSFLRRVDVIAQTASAQAGRVIKIIKIEIFEKQCDKFDIVI